MQFHKNKIQSVHVKTTFLLVEKKIVFFFFIILSNQFRMHDSQPLKVAIP